MRAIILLFCCMFFSSFAVSSTDEEKIRRLEITVEQLSTQLAEKTLENKRLTAALKETLSANRKGEKVVSGCDLDGYKKAVAFSSGAIPKERASLKFLRDSGSKCTQSQLEQLTVEVNRLTYPNDSRELIRYYQKH